MSQFKKPVGEMTREERKEALREIRERMARDPEYAREVMENLATALSDPEWDEEAASK